MGSRRTRRTSWRRTPSSRRSSPAPIPRTTRTEERQVLGSGTEDEDEDSERGSGLGGTSSSAGDDEDEDDELKDFGFTNVATLAQENLRRLSISQSHGPTPRVSVAGPRVSVRGPRLSQVVHGLQMHQEHSYEGEDEDE